MNTVWGSMSIQVPSQMIIESKNGVKLRDTLTRRGNISQYKKRKAFKLTTGGTHTNILDQGARLDLNNLQKTLMEEKKLFKNRKK